MDPIIVLCLLVCFWGYFGFKWVVAYLLIGITIKEWIKHIADAIREGK